MNKKVIALFLIMASQQIQAQTLAPSPAQNFNRKETVLVAGKKTDADVLSLTVDNKSTVYEYHDGAGRPIQKVGRQASPLKNDLIQPIVYDNKGRPSIGYLPYRSTATNGGYRTSAVSEQGTFFSSPPAGVTGDTRPRTNTVYEDSPLDRVLKSTKTGLDFDNKFVEVVNLVNVSTDFAVRKWEVVNGLPRSTTTYPNNTLSIVQTKDEQNHLNREYTDWLGRTVLTQVQSAASVWMSTYYVYNDYNELMFLIPPASSATLTPDSTHSNLWHFRYEYDDLGRQIGSKAPGTDWVYTIYDRWDRPVLSQDGVQRAKSTPEWTYVKYDSHNRPIITGIFTSSSTRATLTSNVAAASGRFESRNTSAQGYSLNVSYPTTALDASILSITYYDDYSFRTNIGWSNDNFLYAFQEVPEWLLTSFNTAVKGQVTGSKSRSQGTDVGWV
ncbi:DUF6443 domain-containing protein, partial [Aquiflexum sp.]|uniref:DUF6443 domain-containing protein n=1 Tax=Aquiflexum sp. TaxID=1872584 RepID=UPI0035937308